MIPKFQIFKKFPWRAVLLISLCALFFLPIGAKIGHKYSWLSTEKTIKATGVAEKVTAPTQATTVNNDLILGKKTKGENISIIMSPDNDQSPTQIITNDTCFSKTDFEKLKPSTIRRMKRDMDKN